MDLNDLRYFALIVDHGGFTAAERVTHVHRSKLSRRVAQLEDTLGVRLLQRTTRRLSLTEAGEVFYQHCAAMLVEAEAAHEAINQLRSEPVGTVRITCPVVMAHFYLAELIARFMVANPKVRVELDATDRSINLIEERVDIAVRARDTARHDPGLVARKVGTGRFILVASPSYLGDHPRPQTPAELCQFDWVGGLGAGEEQVWSLINNEGEATRVTARPRLLCTDLNTQYQAVIGGVGMALLPSRIASKGLKYGALEQLLPHWSTAEEDIHVLFASRRGMLPSVRALLDYLFEHLPEALQG
ncbi:LysR substrate-binding domain-containing protein [Mangrovitalea sediminis]|uniref:LysR substrate-binding domain-containing protein n=1 Tax=Mangrovitalea sediminis TaxID=1982043 RepID=UPI000BE61AE7|nr:LysR substrate-binding domain-containing protein [Mangrovitalea sediminis]